MLLRSLRDWVFGSFYCTINNFIAYLSVAVSVFTLMAISIDRLVQLNTFQVLFSQQQVPRGYFETNYFKQKSQLALNFIQKWFVQRFIKILPSKMLLQLCILKVQPREWFLESFSLGKFSKAMEGGTFVMGFFHFLEAQS